MEMGSPPFMGFEIYELPEDLRDEVLDELRREPDRDQQKVPCSWFDTSAKKCRNHKHRPTLCRDFEIGSQSCQDFRHFYGISDQ
jgi:Fe-S-cluster containining protein